jgi:hypothetical protein
MFINKTAFNNLIEMLKNEYLYNLVLKKVSLKALLDSRSFLKEYMASKRLLHRLVFIKGKN